MKLEEDIASFLGTEAAIIYAQAFAAVSSVIPAFAKRGDIIVADRGVNFAIHKGLQISRSTIRWYAHGDMKDLERVLQNVEREQKRKGGKLTKKFIVAEGVFENDGMMLELPKVVRDRVVIWRRHFLFFTRPALMRASLSSSTSTNTASSSMRASRSEWSVPMEGVSPSTLVFR